MSSILEALEKAEEERLRGAAGRVRPVRRSGEDRGLNFILFAALVAGLLLLNLVLWWSLGDAPEAVGPKRAVSAGTDTEKAPSAAPPPQAETVLSLQEQLKRNAAPSVRPLIDEAQVTPKSVLPTPSVAHSEPVPAVAGEVPVAAVEAAEVQRAATPLVPSEAQTATEPELPATGDPEPGSALVPAAQAVPAPAAAAAPEEPIPLVWELPRELREKVLRLKSSVHVYHELAEQRFVIINMHRYGEGDILPPDGFRLQRIDRNGMVIDYGDGLVRLPRP